MIRQPTPPFPAAETDTVSPKRLAYTVAEMLKLFPTSRSSIYRAIAKGTLRSTRVLGTRMIDARSIEAMFGEVPKPNS